MGPAPRPDWPLLAADRVVAAGRPHAGNANAAPTPAGRAGCAGCGMGAYPRARTTQRGGARTGPRPGS
eukprot:5717596-Lingulodinium_polyedra.AAC.1